MFAGDYGKIIVKQGATLVFSGGIYNVRSIKAKGRSALLFEGPSEMRVLKNFKAGKDTFVGPGDETAISAADIVFFVAGNKVKLARNSVAEANFYTRDGKISFRGSRAAGGFIGKKVTLGKGSKISVDSFVSE